MSQEIIDSRDGLLSLCRQLEQSHWLALDTEFMRERTYYPRLCLVQIANEERIACVDPLLVEDLSPLGELLLRRDITKVVHAGHQDLEIFHQLYGEVPAPVFDTQIAATLAGFTPQIGYARLVEEMLGVTLDKTHTRSDWSRRPLAEAEYAYAANDVRYLRDIYLRLHQQLDNNGRLTWLEHDFAALVDDRRYRSEPGEAWKRVKQIDRLRPRAFTIARELAAWREREAMQRDRPRQWLLRDEMLLDIARRQPADRNALNAVRGASEALQRARVQPEALLAVVAEAAELPAASPPPRAANRLDPAQEPLVDILMGVLRQCADNADVAATMIASRKDLEKLVGGQRQLPLLEGWRGEIAGRILLAVLEGQRDVQITPEGLQISGGDSPASGQ